MSSQQRAFQLASAQRMICLRVRTFSQFAYVNEIAALEERRGGMRPHDGTGGPLCLLAFHCWPATRGPTLAV